MKVLIVTIVVDKCIAKLEACDAIEACIVESREMVDKAWDAMDKVLEVRSTMF